MFSFKRKPLSNSSISEGVAHETQKFNEELNITNSLEALQSDEQRRVLDTVAQIRKCGLESVLSLPQLAVCGDQSAGKSSVLEALTEIPFPRNDNLCTRFATEIILRRAPTNSLTIKVIPDNNRPTVERDSITGFKESITNFDELPVLMNKVSVLMGIEGVSDSNSQIRAFARDVLSIEIEGPSRPQLTLVDLPGLIQTETKGVTKADVDLVAEITDHYISQPRTICLAVVSAANDYANQGILRKVREIDPKGERTLGIITKPDRLPSGSGSEHAFISLARNEDVIFTLGWHVLKNRSFKESAYSFLQRNASEAAYFRKSNFKILAKDCVGIDSLKTRLSQLLFDHVRQELPKLREDLDNALKESKDQMDTMGRPRTTSPQCRAYLAQLSLEYYEVCKAAVDGRYEGDYFTWVTHSVFSPSSSISIRRLRAVVQYMNGEFAKRIRTSGHKYHFNHLENAGAIGQDNFEDVSADEQSAESTIPNPEMPTRLTHSQALGWVAQVLVRTRGRELSGNFNPLLVGELFWEQSSNWHRFATDHVEDVAQVCNQFLAIVLEEICPKDIRSNLWSFQIRDALKERREESVQELEKIIVDIKSYPINYNHYYTDTIKKRRQARDKASLAKCIGDATKEKLGLGLNVDIDQVLAEHTVRSNPSIKRYSCEEALDCVFSIYKVCRFFQGYDSHMLIWYIPRSSKRHSSQTLRRK